MGAERRVSTPSPSRSPCPGGVGAEAGSSVLCEQWCRVDLLCVDRSDVVELCVVHTLDMMPLAPERSTICLPARPKADFSIDFIVGNNGKKSCSSSNSDHSVNSGSSSSPPPPLRSKGPTSPLCGRRAASPRFLDDPRSPESLEDEDEVRARLLSLQSAQAALPGAGALHGLVHPLGLPLLPRVPPCEPSPASPPSPHSSPPQSPPAHPHAPLGPLFRSVYRPEPLLVPHLQHPHLSPPPGPGMHPGLHHYHSAPPKDSYPLYPWLLSRHGRIFPHRFPAGPDFAGFLLHPFRKPKRIRTAFSPSQLLKLEHAFENNHYVVGAERKQVAQALGLSETQVKVWFQNRRTKHKRTEQEEEAKAQRSKQSGGESNNNNKPPQESRSPTSPISHRPVDLSSHEDDSRTDSES